MTIYKYTFFVRDMSGTTYEWQSNDPSFSNNLKNLWLENLDTIEFVSRSENEPEGGLISLTEWEMHEEIEKAKSKGWK